MRNLIKKFWGGFDYSIKRLCGRPSPTKRLIAVLFIGGILAAVNIWFVVSSIYSIGKNDAEMELMKLQHIEMLELQKKSSINHLKNQEHDE